MTNTYTRKKIQHYSYGLTDVIGKGYSSQVYKGRNDQNSESVAVKVIDLKMLKNQINKILLENQIEILNDLKNLPHILKLHDVFTTKNNTYIITQLCESDLSKIIIKGLSEQQSILYMQQIITGYLNFARKNIIHRDLKPANILIINNDQLKIADFGFAIKVIDASKSSKYNVGSPLYMAPQSLKKNEYSLKTDIWALGVIFFQILTGETPWKAKNEKQLVKKIQNERIEDVLSKHNMSLICKQFLRKCLIVDKEKRMSIDELAEFTFTCTTSSILMEKNFNMVKTSNTQRTNLLMTKQNQLSYYDKLCADRSAEKRLASKDCSENKYTTQKYETIKQSLPLKPQKMKEMSPSIKVQLKHRISNDVNKQNPNTTSNNLIKMLNTKENESKYDKKLISRILISEIHFCRFLYKLLTRIIESSKKGLLKFSKIEVSQITENYVGIIKHKLDNLLSDKTLKAIISPDYLEEYKQSNDCQKIMKISKQYKGRYSLELKQCWQYSNCIFSPSVTVEMIEKLQKLLKANENQVNFTEQYCKEVVILDYLMTSKQLIQLFQNGQNYEKFAKKSRIQQIVEGKTAEISWQLYRKIINRAAQMLEPKKQASFNNEYNKSLICV